MVDCRAIRARVARHIEESCGADAVHAMLAGSMPLIAGRAARASTVTGPNKGGCALIGTRHIGTPVQATTALLSVPAAACSVVILAGGLAPAKGAVGCAC
jgi:hypothetical protein